MRYLRHLFASLRHRREVLQAQRFLRACDLRGVIPLRAEWGTNLEEHAWELTAFCNTSGFLRDGRYPGGRHAERKIRRLVNDMLIATTYRYDIPGPIVPPAPKPIDLSNAAGYGWQDREELAHAESWQGVQ